MISTVSLMTFVSIGIVMLSGLVIPAFLFFFFKKKTGCGNFVYFSGSAVFFLFAIVLKGSVHSILLAGGRAEMLMSNTLLFALYGGFMAGLFEESGRFIAFKIFRKKAIENDSTALFYGAGHAGFEIFWILFVCMITNIVYAVFINTGNTDMLTINLTEKQKAEVEAVFTALCTTNPLLFLFAIVERFAALTIHISLSVLVWFAAKNGKKWYLYPAAIILHMCIDVIAAFGKTAELNIAMTEIMLYVFALMCGLLALFIWKKEKRKQN